MIENSNKIKWNKITFIKYLRQVKGRRLNQLIYKKKWVNSQTKYNVILIKSNKTNTWNLTITTTSYKEIINRQIKSNKYI